MASLREKHPLGCVLLNVLYENVAVQNQGWSRYWVGSTLKTFYEDTTAVFKSSTNQYYWCMRQVRRCCMQRCLLRGLRLWFFSSKDLKQRSPYFICK
jgi:hypothetical protein